MEKRKAPRYPIKLRVYFVEEGVIGVTENVSIYGCYVKAEVSASEGIVTDILIEIPVLGVLPLKGYIQHAKEGQKGIGMQYISVRFAEDQEIYYNLYRKFIGLLKELDVLRRQYLDLAAQDKVKMLAFPEDTF